jgi:hypothetical protein
MLDDAKTVMTIVKSGDAMPFIYLNTALFMSLGFGRRIGVVGLLDASCCEKPCGLAEKKQFSKVLTALLNGILFCSQGLPTISFYLVLR